VSAALVPFLPVPMVARQGDRYVLDFDRPQSIGRLRTFWGNFGMFVRAWTYIRENGPDGLRNVSGMAVLNANYLRALLDGTYHLPYRTEVLHEVVFSDRDQKKAGVSAMDIAKQLIDHGIHPPTVYFPLVVQGALMMEPTETESKETLETFAEALKQIAAEAVSDPGKAQQAPTRTHLNRLDETRAARFPVLRWTPGMDPHKQQVDPKAAKAAS